MEHLDEYLGFIKEVELLKGVLRSANHSSGRPESTAEHSWRLALLASVMLEEFPGLDRNRVMIMCLIHDLGELYEGDIPAILFPDPAKKLADERQAAEKIFSLLPSELNQKYLAIWREYSEGTTDEARLVKMLDKTETIIQHNQGHNPEDFDYEFNLTYGAEYFRDNELAIELRKRLDLETLTRHKQRFT